MNILVIAPHPDDETIGCGGTIYLHARRGDHVHVVWLTSGELGLKRMKPDRACRVRTSEARKAASILKVRELTFLNYPDWGVAEAGRDIRADLAQILGRNRPEKIYLPHPLDAHPDHQPVWALAQMALRSMDDLFPELRGYEIWSPLAQVDYVEDIAPVMTRKLQALRAHGSQLKEFDYVRAVRGLNQFRGALAGRCRYAEVFQDLSTPEPHAP